MGCEYQRIKEVFLENVWRLDNLNRRDAIGINRYHDQGRVYAPATVSDGEENRIGRVGKVGVGRGPGEHGRNRGRPGCPGKRAGAGNLGESEGIVGVLIIR
jgi:hypothetical protein